MPLIGQGGAASLANPVRPGGYDRPGLLFVGDWPVGQLSAWPARTLAGNAADVQRVLDTLRRNSVLPREGVDAQARAVQVFGLGSVEVSADAPPGPKPYPCCAQPAGD